MELTAGQQEYIDATVGTDTSVLVTGTRTAWAIVDADDDVVNPFRVRWTVETPTGTVTLDEWPPRSPEEQQDYDDARAAEAAAEAERVANEEAAQFQAAVAAAVAEQLAALADNG